MPPPDYGPSAVWPYAVAAAVVLATSLFYFFTRQVTFFVHAFFSTPSRYRPCEVACAEVLLLALR